MENASPKAIGMISGHSVPDRSSCLAQNRYIGMTTTCGGSIIIEMTSISDRCRPRKRNLASAYATGSEDTTVRTVPRPAYSRVFFHQVRKPGGVEHLLVVGPLEGVRPQVPGEGLLVAHQRGEHEEDERQHEEECRGHAERVDGDPVQQRLAACHAPGRG